MTMITGAHSMIFSKDAEADAAFLRDVLELPNYDAGGGWMIFGPPLAEVAVHPSEKNDVHELYFMCDDLAALVDKLATKGVTCAPVQQRGWGVMTEVPLPGGGWLGVYEPRHARPAMNPERATKKAPKRAAKKPATKKAEASTRGAPTKKKPAKRAAKKPATKKAARKKAPRTKLR
jgi:hypothetical protein